MKVDVLAVDEGFLSENAFLGESNFFEDATGWFVLCIHCGVDLVEAAFGERIFTDSLE